MKFWLLLLLVLAGAVAVFFGGRKAFAKKESAPSADVTPLVSSPPPPPRRDENRLVRCESFWARDGRVVGAFGEGLIFEGQPDSVEGHYVLYRASRGRAY